MVFVENIIGMCMDMDDLLVQEFTSQVAGSICSPLWERDVSFPSGMRVGIDSILTHNHAFERYVLAHRDEISDFQLESVLSMLMCARDECGGITYGCSGCGETCFVPFRCHSRVCPRCGKRYAEQWGRMLMTRFFRCRIGT